MSSPDRRSVRAALPDTVFGSGSSFRGDLRAGGMVRIEGELVGSVTTPDGVVVGAKASVEGDIDAGFAVICGKVKGDLRIAGDLRIMSGAVILGDLAAERLAMESGGTVSGILRIEGRKPRKKKGRSES